MKENIKVCKSLINKSKINKLIDFAKTLPYEKLKKNRYAETWSSSADSKSACNILDIIGSNALRNIADNIAGLEEGGVNIKNLVISSFTVIRIDGIIPGLPWHRDSFFDKTKNHFIGICPYGYKAYISLSPSSGHETVFAPFIDKDFIVNSFIKSLFISLNPFIKKINEALDFGDVMIFRTDIMHKRPWCIFGNRVSIIISYVWNADDLKIYQSDEVMQNHYRKLTC